MPQLKLPKSLPKSLPKLHAARRILRRRSAGTGAGAGGVNGGNAASRTSGAVAGVATGAVTVAAGIAAVPHAQFINRTPQRISTISSLMHEQGVGAGAAGGGGGGGVAGQLQATYCSAGSLDDDYYAPYGGGGSGVGTRASRPISPIKMPPPAPAIGGGGGGATLGATAANLTQRLQRGYKSLSELRLKHLFAKQTTVRRDNIEVQRYVEQYEAERRVEEQVQAQRDRQIADNYRIHISTLPISRQNTLQEQQQEQEVEGQQQQQQAQPVKLPPPPALRPHSLAEHSGDESGLEQAPVTTVRSKKKKKPGIAATRFAKVRQPPLPMPMEEQQQQEQQQQPQTELPMRQAMRQNLKRLRKSIKRVSSQQPQQQQQQHDSDEDVAEHEVKVRSNAARGATLRARLRRFTSSEQLQQRWRKSFKGSTAEQQTTTAGGTGVAAGAGLGLGMGAQLERTMAKLNEKMQQMKFFHSRSHSAPEQNKPNTVGREPNEIDDEELEATYHRSDSSDDGDDDSDDSGHEVRAEDAFEEDDKVEKVQVRRLQASTAWSSESLEEDEHMTPQQQQQQQRQLACSDYPRVLIHQQHSDAYESTLIIAVASTPSPEPTEEEIASNTVAWLPNEQIIAGFKQQQQQQLQWPAPALYKAKSIDIFECEGGAAAAFADFDEALRNAPVLRISAGTTNTNTSSGDDEEDSGSHATRIRLQLTPQIGNSCESLMEQQEPLEYAEDEREEDQRNRQREREREREREQLTDAERPPSVSPPPPPLPQRRPPAAPPSAAPPIYDQLPPPLPVSKPPPAVAVAELASALTTAAPAPTPAAAAAAAAASAPATVAASSAAPPAAPIPAPSLPSLTRLTQRSASMTRPSKPLVKTSSLRLTYNEQVHPGDVGKVNKLITRFEGGRPRLCARRLTHSEELTTCSDAEDEPEPEPEPEQEQATPTNVQRIPYIVTTQPGNNNNNNNVEEVTPSLQQLQQLNLDRQNSNCSRSSEYGSPLSYPMRRSATPTRHMGAGTATGTGSGSATGRALAPLSVQHSRRSRRSMTRDDDNFYSFDSDEGNV